MKKIMIIGASILQLPAILKAKEMGLNVIAVDKDKHAIGFEEADITINISANDISKVVEAAKKYNIDGIMTLASDMPMRTVAAVAKELNLVGISEDTALKATNKALMRQCLKLHNVPIPNFFRVDDFESYLSCIQHFPGKFIVKPADNSGSRGVFLVSHYSDKKNIAYAFQYSKNFSRSGELVVEEFMEGPEVSVETLSVDGYVNIIAITDKLTTGAPNFVEIGHSQPTSLSDEIIKKIEQITREAVKAIGIRNGPSHTEIIVTNEGPKIVELGARLGGDNITTHLVPLSTGVDMVKCCIEIALGNKPEFEKKINMGSAIRYFQTPKGKINSVNGLCEAKLITGVKQIKIMKNTDDTVGKINSSSNRIGFVIAQSSDWKSAIDLCNKALSIIKIDIE